MRPLLDLLVPAALSAQQSQTSRPFGTLRDQADRQQRWLDERMKTVLPALMKKHGVEMWIVPMREYKEDPFFASFFSPTTFAARPGPIYLFSAPCAPATGTCTKPF